MNRLYKLGLMALIGVTLGSLDVTLEAASVYRGRARGSRLPSRGSVRPGMRRPAVHRAVFGSAPARPTVRFVDEPEYVEPEARTRGILPSVRKQVAEFRDGVREMQGVFDSVSSCASAANIALGAAEGVKAAVTNDRVRGEGVGLINRVLRLFGLGTREEPVVGEAAVNNQSVLAGMAAMIGLGFFFKEEIKEACGIDEEETSVAYHELTLQSHINEVDNQPSVQAAQAQYNLHGRQVDANNLLREQGRQANRLFMKKSNWLSWLTGPRIVRRPVARPVAR